MKVKICKVCCRGIGDQHGEVVESRKLVIVDEKRQLATILNKGDCLCEDCSRVATYYRRVR